MRRLWLTALCALVVLSPSLALTAQKLTSWKILKADETFQDHQLLLIDVSDSLTGGSEPTIYGESVATGDWSKAVDARGWKVASLSVNEYGSGSISVSLWNCRQPGPVGVISGVDLPGIEDPNNTPSAADPDPLCSRVATGIDGIGIAAGDGDSLEITGRTFHSLAVRIDTCTGNCDAQIGLQLTR